MPEHRPGPEQADAYGERFALCEACEQMWPCMTVQIDRLRGAVALLNSMVLSGEDHSEKSRAIVREALG